MNIITVEQGSDAWRAFRLTHFGASEAAAMMSDSRHMTRNDLLDVKRGNSIKTTDYTESLFARGHESEAQARPLVVALFATELFPVVGVSTDHPKLSASFDGLSVCGSVVWEHKLYNKRLVEQINSGELQPHYFWQLEQQLLVSGAEKALLTTMHEGELLVAEYTAVTGRQADLVAGWEQFADDLARKPSRAVQVEVRAKASGWQLPVLSIEASGHVSASNLPAWRDAAMQLIESVNTDLVTDDDFAAAAESVKWCSQIEKRTQEAREYVLGQSASIASVIATLDEIRVAARETRLPLNRAVTEQKAARKNAIQASAVAEIREAIAEAESQIRPIRVVLTFDVPAAARGLKTLRSIQDAADAEVAKAKIQIAEQRARAATNLALLSKIGDDYSGLFHDLDVLGSKATLEFAAIVAERVQRFDQAREKTLEAEREKIRAEEAAKLVDNAAQPTKQQPQSKTLQQAADTQPVLCGYAPPPIGEVNHPADGEVVRVLFEFDEYPLSRGQSLMSTIGHYDYDAREWVVAGYDRKAGCYCNATGSVRDWEKFRDGGMVMP